jgi:AcrR family transcriptional regulator
MAKTSRPAKKKPPATKRLATRGRRGAKRFLTRPERRRQLLDLAAEIVTKDGPTGLTMERLARVAGVTKPIIYDHFENADAVVIALLDEAVERYAAPVRTIMAAAAPREDTARLAVHAYFETLCTEPLLRALMTNPLSSPTFDRYRRELRQRYILRGVKIYEDVLDPHTAEAAISMFTAAVDEGTRHFVERGVSQQDIEKLIVRFARALLTNDQTEPLSVS